MDQRQFVFTDVFTSNPFEGNQLAVFPDGVGLTAAQMQTLAREINFSETTFLFPSTDAEADFQVRIFTPWRELPFAGHPIIGTAYVIAERGMKKAEESRMTIRLLTGVGEIAVDAAIEDGVIGELWMTQPVPKISSVEADSGALAEALGVDAEDLALGRLPLEVCDNGIPVLIVPVASLEASRRLAPNARLLSQIAKSTGALTILTFTTETVWPDSHVHTRVFVPDAGIAEDPATGSASGPLGVYLIRHGLVKCEERSRVQSEQGLEIQRPSILRIEVESDGREIRGVRVGGHARIVGDARMNVPRAG